jgi:hypothetical protein
MARYLNDFERALFGPTFTDPSAGWRKYAVERSFTDWFLSTELVKAAKHAYHSPPLMYKVGHVNHMARHGHDSYAKL